jgi:hypothetical protein
MLVKAAAGSRRYGSIKQLRRFAQMGEPGRQAILALLIVMGEDADRAVALGRMADAARVRRRLMLVRFFCRKWRATDDKYWGRVGYVFSCLGKSAAVIRWMKGWRIRSNVESWMLYNLAGAYLSVGRYRSARSILRHVVEHLMPKTAVDPQLALWCTIGAYLDNDLPSADRLLHETPEDIVPEGDRRLRELIVTVREILSGPRRRSSLTRDRQRKIGAIEASYLENGFLPTKRLSKLALLKVARHTHRPWMMWQQWRSLHPRIANTIGIFIACCWFTFLVIVFG